MESKKLKRLATFTVIISTILIILLLVFLNLSDVFFNAAGLPSLFIFVILTWAFVERLIDHFRFSKPKFLKIITVVFIVLIMLSVILIIVFIGPRTIFSAILIIDVVLLLATPIHLLHDYVVFLSPRVTSAQMEMGPAEREVRIDYNYLRRAAGLPVDFSYASLEAATGGFGDLLGRGASGAVFRGVLEDGTPVAVKRIAPAPRAMQEFRAEFSAIASVQHVNLNGSLNTWIFPGERARSACLSWEMRRQVAVDVAKALAYIHHDCRSRILHLDVKPENVLLDGKFRARVTDFGLSRLMGREESRVVTTVRGTRGYLAPEWFLEGAISEKSDVYSFGIVLLEIVGGRRCTCMIDGGERWSYFPRQVSECAREGRVMGVVDERIVGEVEEWEVKVLIYVGLWCVNEKPGLRPTMAQVVDMLEFRVPVDEPPEDTQALMANLFMGGGTSSTSVSNRGGSAGIEGGYPTE
ncbi:putative receptor-like protein kinase [Acorus gramineus]|uniref:Receptor-like protein kinase n=1 Tax=Acorus gramineus TaxID=55184 RepID=A0AAV9A6J4_ACOGR|nr:putative receptor-like protein kinase [Acorus gramineus]